MIHLSPDGGATSPPAARLSLPHSFRGGTLLSLHFAFRRARLAAPEAAVIYARETDA
jgi:hypothetical protein